MVNAAEEREFRNAARAFAKQAGVRWASGPADRGETSSYLCDLASSPEYADCVEAARLRNAERALHESRKTRPKAKFF
jgi:hypothetical protein